MTCLLAGRRILVVEDEMLVLLGIETVLAELGCTSVSVAANVTDALSMVGAGQFDAAMLDVNLNGEKSYPVADALTLREIPFIFSTGYGDHGERTDLASRPVLRKPYGRASLVAALKALIPQADGWSNKDWVNA